MAKKKPPSVPLFLLLLVFCFLLAFLNIDIWRERAEKRRHLNFIQNELEQTLETREGAVSLDDDFVIERIAREQLLMAREGEEVVVILRNEEETLEEEEEEEPGFFQQLMEIIR